ncbi:MAG: tetratricopeptide repeat protein [Planctomycetia bacterium]|nr:tetratricopeptide repeat protein [Planctomycetia bacterium]
MNRKRSRSSAGSRRRAAEDPNASAARLDLVVDLYRQGRLDEAIAACRRVVVERPDLPEPLHLLGLLLVKSGALEAAESSLRAALDLNPACAAAWKDLGNLYGETGRPDEALRACERAADICPEDLSAALSLGNALKAAGRYDDAAAVYRRVIARDPACTAARRELCAVLRAAGRTEETRRALEDWLTQEPGHPIASHILAAFAEGQTPDRASDRYVQSVFDQFAGSFEEQLARLEYRGPDLIAAALAARLGPARAALDVLDAGCGTGLCGPVLRPYARTLDGVDLSPQMLDVARQKQLFDHLETAELTAFLAGHEQRWDLIVACDTFNYFGQLEPLLAAAARALQPAGTLVFTLERDDAPPDSGSMPAAAIATRQIRF